MGIVSKLFGKEVPATPQTVAEIVSVFSSIVKQLEDHMDSKNQEVVDISESINRLTAQRTEANAEAVKAEQVRANILKIIESS